MWIVVFKGGKRHSAWVTREAADKQVVTLKDYGYRRVAVQFDSTVSCDDGHYYV